MFKYLLPAIILILMAVCSQPAAAFDIKSVPGKIGRGLVKTGKACIAVPALVVAGTGAVLLAGGAGTVAFVYQDEINDALIGKMSTTLKHKAVNE